MHSLTSSHRVEWVAGQLILSQNEGNVQYIVTWCQKVPTRIALHGDPSWLQESSAGRSAQAGGRHLFAAERNWAVRPFYFIVYNISLRGKTACVDFFFFFYQDKRGEDCKENTVIHSLTPRKMSLIIQTGGETIKAERLRPWSSGV